MSEDSWLPWVLGAVLLGLALMAILIPPETLDIRPDREDPVADAGPDQTVAFGESVVLDGSGSSDDKGIKSHEWAITEGPNTVFRRGETIEVLFGAPGVYTVVLKVTDHAGKESSDEVVVTVLG